MDEVFRKRLESYGRGLQEGKLDDVMFDAAWGIEERDTRRLGWSKYERQAKVFLELATAAKEGRSPNTSVADRDLPSPSVRPVPEPVQQPETPDWNARYEHWKQKYVSDFIPYAGNRSLTLKLNNGKSVVGTVRYIASDSIILDLKSGGAVKFQSDQISIDQRFQLFAPSYAEDKASRKVEIEKVHWAKHKKLLD